MADRSSLTTRLARGEVDAFGELYDQYGTRVLAYLRGFTRDAQDAEDLLQTVMLRLVRHRRRLRTVENLKAFLYTMARNEALRRAGRRRRPLNDATVLEGLACRPEGEADVLALRRALTALSRERLEVVTLHVHHGLTFREIAEVLAVPANTAASRYRRALADLRRFLETADVEC